MPDSTTSSLPIFVAGLHAFADRYAGFVLDQWGVLHDGRAPYAGVHETLGELRRHGKRIVLLSNSGRRAEHSRRHLSLLGFDPGMFDAIVTSGETAWTILKHRDLPPYDRLGRRCLLFTRDDDREVVADTGIELVDAPEKADFLFLAGVDSPRLGLEDYRPALEIAARRNLPALCSNPDLHAPSAGGLVLAPGALAQAYEEQGGEVLYVGKPHAPIYRLCFEALHGLAARDLVAIGDSLDHDIRGANGVGIAAAFVSGGLHAADFPLDASPEALAHRLEELTGDPAARPGWVLPRFVW
jgi:HAD superfamily hydrolase (TIGR01459 family)